MQKFSVRPNKAASKALTLPSPSGRGFELGLARDGHTTAADAKHLLFFPRPLGEGQGEGHHPANSKHGSLTAGSWVG